MTYKYNNMHRPAIQALDARRILHAAVLLRAFKKLKNAQQDCSFLFSRVAGGRLVGGCDVLTYFPVLALVRWDVYLLTTNRPPQGGAQNVPTPAARTRPTPTNYVCHKLCSGFSGTRAVFPNQRGGNTEHGNTEHGTHP